jgi:serine/threonine protein kinase/Tfp pilus assembly protein PilF
MARDDQLADLLLCWEEHFEQGEDLPPEDLCRDRPELRPALEAGIAALKRVAWVNQPIRDTREPAPLLLPAGSTALSPRTTSHPPLAGRYRLDRLIAEGGCGQVWLGFDLELQRPVAAKLPHRRLVSQPGDAAVYLREARTVAKLDHPHIVPVFDVGKDEHCPCFIVSKLIQGSTLKLRLREARPSPWEAAALLALIAEALHYAHGKGIVHRDIKPGNILLDGTGKPYVTDFGVALREQEAGQGPSYAGTLAYMSPEQARGEADRVDGRSDVFSLGVVFYELLTGQLPFGATSATELLKQIVTSEPRPPRRLDEAIPEDLERICLKALSKRVSERYTTARDLAHDLRDFLGERTLCEDPPGDRKDASSQSDTVATRSSDTRPVPIVPKHRKSFGISYIKVSLRGTVAAVVLAVALGGVAWWQRTPYAERQLYRGLAAYREGKYDQAAAALSEALAAQPSLMSARYARARAYQRCGEFELAFADYALASKAAPDGRIFACMAYCLNRLNWQRSPEDAHGCYEAAITAGFAPAAVYNNLGYCYLSQRKLEEAKANLDRALDLDLGMQAAWHNRAVYALHKIFREVHPWPNPDLTKEHKALLIQGLQDAETALRLAPATDELHYNTALLLALNRRKADWADKALTHLEEAARKGRNPGLWKDDPTLSPLRDHPRFQALLKQAPTASTPPTARLVDPVTD